MSNKLCINGGTSCFNPFECNLNRRQYEILVHRFRQNSNTESIFCSKDDTACKNAWFGTCFFPEGRNI